MAAAGAAAAGRLAGVAGRGPAPDCASAAAAGRGSASERGRARAVSGSRCAMKARPLVLVTACTGRKGAEFSDASLSLSAGYPRAIVAAGGMPWVLPSLPFGNVVAEAVRRCDGVMLTGGDDVQPQLYATHLTPRLERTVSTVDAARDLFELLVIREVFRQRKPLLAICRGQQIL